MGAPNPDNYRYRLSLTAKQIQYIMKNLITPDNMHDPAILDLLTAFATVNKKIAIGEAPDYIPTPRPTVADKLGMDSTVSVPETFSFGTDKLRFASKEEYWKWAYDRYAAAPDTCDTGILEAASEHMYLHDMLEHSDEALVEAGELPEFMENMK